MKHITKISLLALATAFISASPAHSEIKLGLAVNDLILFCEVEHAVSMAEATNQQEVQNIVREASNDNCLLESKAGSELGYKPVGQEGSNALLVAQTVDDRTFYGIVHERNIKPAKQTANNTGQATADFTEAGRILMDSLLNAGEESSDRSGSSNTPERANNNRAAADSSNSATAQTEEIISDDAFDRNLGECVNIMKTNKARIESSGVTLSDSDIVHTCYHSAIVMEYGVQLLRSGEVSVADSTNVQSIDYFEALTASKHIKLLNDFQTGITAERAKSLQLAGAFPGLPQDVANEIYTNSTANAATYFSVYY